MTPATHIPSPDESTTHEIPDGELVRRARQQDEDAFARLVDRYKNVLVGYLTRLVGCRDRAEDVAQETFVRFYEKLDNYRDEGSLAGYLFRIATNRVRSEERRRKRWRLLQPFLAHTGFAHGVFGMGRGDSNGDGPTAPPVEPVAAEADQPADHLLAREAGRQVGAALTRLDLRFRAPLVLREIEGLSYGEIADSLGLNEGTVKSRLHRGRELLKHELAPYWNGGRA